MPSEEQAAINEDLRSGERGRTLQALESLNEMLRERVADASSIQPLTLQLRDEDVDIRRATTWSMGKLAQNKVAGSYPLDELIALLIDGDDDVS